MMNYVNRDGRVGYCWCGCGKQTKISTYTNSRENVKKGEPTRFLRGHHVRKSVRYIEEDRGYTSPCWIWQLKVGDNGYGQVTVGGRYMLAHRYYYEQYKSAIAEGLTIDHLCRVRECVNPEHLEAVPMHINQRRGSHTILCEEMVLALKEAHSHGVELPTLETLTGVKRRTIRAAVNGENWSL